MAKKEESVNMVESFKEFKDLKNIDKSTMIRVLEESFRSVLSKQFGTDENFDVIMNPDTGDVQIFQTFHHVVAFYFKNKFGIVLLPKTAHTTLNVIHVFV